MQCGKKVLIKILQKLVLEGKLKFFQVLFFSIIFENNCLFYDLKKKMIIWIFFLEFLDIGNEIFY